MVIVIEGMGIRHVHTATSYEEELRNQLALLLYVLLF